MYYFLRSYGMTDSTGPFCSRWPWLLLQSSGLTWAWKSRMARSQCRNWIGPKCHSGFPSILRKSPNKLFGKPNTWVGVDLELSSGAPQTSFMWRLHMAWSLRVAGFQKVASGSCQVRFFLSYTAISMVFILCPQRPRHHSHYGTLSTPAVIYWPPGLTLLFMEVTDNRSRVFLFIPNSANKLAHLVCLWDFLDLSVPWCHLQLPFPFCFNLSIPWSLKLCHQETTALGIPWQSSS